MKKILIPVVGTIGAGIILISGLSNFAQADNPFSYSHTDATNTGSGSDQPSASSESESLDVRTLGLVGIHYQLFHLNQLASNQIAIWIEDEKGNYVTTIRASSFTAGGGYKIRPESLPEWRKAANWSHASQQEVRKVRLAEQPAGQHFVYWDCADASGKAVKPGTYVYKVEGNIYWANRVVFTGKINVGKNPGANTAAVQFKPANAKSNGRLLANVNATFDPGKSLASAKQDPSANTQG